MFSLKLLLVFVVVIGATATPIQLPLVADNKGTVTCEKVDGYTTEWFLQNTKPEYRSRDLLNDALFYSSGMSAAARTFARKNGMTTIWDIWPCYLYEYDAEPTNKMRCIHNDDNLRQTFYENMSRAFALKAQNFSTVLHSENNYKNPPSDGIWARVEFPTLEGIGKVNWLEKINENRSLSEIFWERPKALLHDLGILKRGVPLPRAEAGRSIYPPVSSQACLTDRALKFYDKVRW